ncbi:glycerophosphodiester phosphodiesterase [Ramlibacter solisilvae]|uniref:Glycerophosphodiester phosphodiesterase n=1 Tax=Ramlibacter tataouinensis TaxID=94132 RepID=A0A127JRX8_9BURK|nr:glycerophosphodiester phosphodiesterase [Ramlibacter tataouinensis]AMO22707.1 glycerophosphodiester phosphodiesterase [Ramlibacter tataouinensis]
MGKFIEKARQATMLVCAAALLAGCAVPQHAKPADPPPFDLQGHRGARWSYPENSLPGFAYALGVGVSTLELDIAITRDRVLFISHDSRLNADITRDADGKFLAHQGAAFVSLNAADLAKYDVGRIKPSSNYAKTFSEQQPIDGTRIPRFAELAALVKSAGNEEVRFAIETKITPQAPADTVGPEEFARLVIAAIRQAGLARRSSILSFDWRTLQVVQKEAPEIPTVYLTMQQSRSIDNIMVDNPAGSPWTAGFQHKDFGSVPKMIKAAGGHTWSCFWRDLTPEQVKEAQALGLKVLAWTVNDAAQMNRMMDMGVNGIVTDRPELLRAEMQRRGLALPRPTPVALPKDL